MQSMYELKPPSMVQMKALESLYARDSDFRAT